MASQFATLFFLAVWHGLHSGYLLCFSLEFIIVNVEKQVTKLFLKRKVDNLNPLLQLQIK